MWSHTSSQCERLCKTLRHIFNVYIVETKFCKTKSFKVGQSLEAVREILMEWAGVTWLLRLCNLTIVNVTFSSCYTCHTWRKHICLDIVRQWTKSWGKPGKVWQSLEAKRSLDNMEWAGVTWLRICHVTIIVNVIFWSCEGLLHKSTYLIWILLEEYAMNEWKILESYAQLSLEYWWVGQVGRTTLIQLTPICTQVSK